MEKTRLIDDRPYRPGQLADFNGLPKTVWPISMRVLEQGNDLLLYQNVDLSKGITPKQHHIYSLLARMGAHPDAPGSITVLICTGESGVTYDRTMAVFDHMLDDTKLRLAEHGEIEGYITKWFNSRRRK